MSFAPVNDAGNAVSSHQEPAIAPEQPTKLKYKSYKKKFLKLRHHFKERMRENSKLYEDEQHATRIARRLQEENDQVLDLLLDVNEKVKIPPQLRYDLRSPTPNASDVPGLEPDTDPIESQEIINAKAALREAKSELDNHQITLNEYREAESSLMMIIDSSHVISTPRTLSDLSRISHTKLAAVPASGMPAELVEQSPTGYLSPAHEEEYLLALDNHIASAPPDVQPLVPRQSHPSDKEKEREAQIHNPVSVYNWLRAHSDNKLVQQDIEKELVPSNTNTAEPSNHKAKSSPKPPSSAGNGSTKPSRKRASSSLTQRLEPEEELLDDEGFVIRGGGEVLSTKGKRKRDGDDAYRPKGGSSKSRKKTKGSSGAAVRRLEPEMEEEEEDV